MYNHWCNIFLLPKIIRDVERICHSFLWKGVAGSAASAKVSWEVVCRPKCEGELGIRTLEEWNISCLSRLIWLIFSGKENLWIAWRHLDVLKDKCFWSIEPGTICSWY